MNFKVNFSGDVGGNVYGDVACDVCGKLIEVSVDSIDTGTLNAKEASEMALEFIRVANELTEFAKEDIK